MKFTTSDFTAEAQRTQRRASDLELLRPHTSTWPCHLLILCELCASAVKQSFVVAVDHCDRTALRLCGEMRSCLGDDR